jgi:hypothetical protein
MKSTNIVTSVVRLCLFNYREGRLWFFNYREGSKVLVVIKELCSRIGTGEAIFKEDSTGPEGSRGLRLPDFQTVGT